MSPETIANYLADPLEEQLLHMVNADPLRTPTFTMFAKPHYFLFTGGTTCSPTPPNGQYAVPDSITDCVTINPKFAYNHGDYSPDIDVTWVGFAGPGVAPLGLDGAGPQGGPPQTGEGTIPGDGLPGTWADHTDIRPTMLYLLGLKDDYINDGRVLVEDLTNPPPAMSGSQVLKLAQLYKQINASVGEFGTDTLIGATAAIQSGTSHSDRGYAKFEKALAKLGAVRDRLATLIKDELTAAAFDGTPIPAHVVANQIKECQRILASAHALAW